MTTKKIDPWTDYQRQLAVGCKSYKTVELPAYNAQAVSKAIARDPRIGKAEARNIHRLLKGRH